MPRMSVRATYALDETTSQRIKRLARTWHVSQAEVIRRSVQAASEQVDRTLAPADVVARYATGPLPRSRQETNRLIESVR
ncbi:MAG: hypothetical protein L0H29_08970, partial [Sinobacteraceae bacterium]|nr:hypothetical protein [Nevskiaceae bacterium]